MEKKQININDFNLFIEVMKSAVKIVDSAKIMINSNGLEIYGARDRTARCEFVSNAVSSDADIEFSIENLNMFNKILQSVKSIHEDDYSNLKFTFDGNNIRFDSKKFKTKFSTQIEDTISKWISKKVTTEMESVFDFTTTSDLIKRLNSHAFMFSDPKDVRIYLEHKDDMEKNSIFATLGNRSTELNNEIVLKFGLLTSGSIDTNALIIDFERLNLFNAVQSNDIKITYTDHNCLLCKSQITGKNNTYFDMNIYCTILKA